MIGGMMLMNREKDTYVIILLWLVLGMIIVRMIYSMRTYYSSADYAATRYVRALMKKDYKQIYSVLEKSSLEAVGGEKEVAAYYKKIYECQNKLVDARITSYAGQTYEIQYQYVGRQEKGKLELVNKENKWLVVFPFESYKLEVFGPSECKIYVDGEQLKSEQLKSEQLKSEQLKSEKKSCYIKENLLPGNYMLQVKLPLKEYKDFYKMINIPKETSLILPYETGTIKIHTAPGLEISMAKSHAVSSSKATLFGDMLVGDYEVQVSDQRGFIKEQKQSITLEEGVKELTFKAYQLSSKGENEKKSFFDDFYKAYEAAITAHDSTRIEGYLQDQPDKRLETAFSDWYIDKKNIHHVEFETAYKDYYLDEMAKLHQIVTETAILDNEETNEVGEKEIRSYRVVVTWDTTVNILQEHWKIQDRRVVESMVAFKDSEGRWVQY